MDVLQQALAYSERGWFVFPCEYKGKTPIINGGFYSAFRDRSRIEQTWGPGSYPSNIAIRTGEQSGILVLDIDAKHNGHEELQKLLAHLDVDVMGLNTYAVRTPGGGAHYYFKHPGFHVGCRTGMRPGIDVKCDGGYVVASPSIGENLLPYSVTNGTNVLLPVPERLLDFIRNAPKGPALLVGAPGDGVVVSGGRNNYLASIAGRFQRTGVSFEALEASLLAENAARCVPPLDAREVSEIARKISRYTPGNPVSTVAPHASGQHTKSEQANGGDWLTKDPGLQHGQSLVVKADTLVQSLIEFLRDKGKVKGKPTGIAPLDKLMGGGKRLGELTCWHAVAKTGKNSLWHKQMHNWLQEGTAIAYASRELAPAEEVLPNLLSIHTQQNVLDVECTEERAQIYAKAIASWPLYFADGYGTLSIHDIQVWVKELAAQGVQHFWFDHLHFMLEEPEDHKLAARYIKELKTIARQENVHIDIIIQPNRLEEGQKLTMNSLKGGAVINQTVDNLIILERVEEEENVVEIKLEFGRSKLVRIKQGKFYLRYNPDTMDYEEVKKEFSKPEIEPQPRMASDYRGKFRDYRSN